MLDRRVIKTQRIKFMSSRKSQSEGETGVYTDEAGCPCCRSDQLLSFAGERFLKEVIFEQIWKAVSCSGGEKGSTI